MVTTHAALASRQFGVENSETIQQCFRLLPFQQEELEELLAALLAFPVTDSCIEFRQGSHFSFSFSFSFRTCHTSGASHLCEPAYVF
jgi:hypothetical protein